MSIDPARLAQAALTDALDVHRSLLEPAMVDAIVAAATVIHGAFEAGNKVLLFGNGGSASDSSHIAAEFVGRFVTERRALPAISLATNDSSLTALANDYGYGHVFVRQLEALGRAGDVAVAISTSGRSPNVLHGLRFARQQGLATIGLTGGDAGEMADAAELCLSVPSPVTARIQEGHILIGHVLCELIDDQIA